MPTTEEDLNNLEKEMRSLKIEYERYFGGGRKRPPSDTQWRVELIIKRYGDRTADMSSGQRFRYSNLTQTYAKYQDIWRKRLQRKEEGTAERHYGAAARQIEAERARTRTKPLAPLFVTALADAEAEASKVDQLYRKLIEARQGAGNEGSSPSFEEFQKFVRRKTQELMQKKGCEQVEYVVTVEDGKVKLKARVRG